MQLKVPGDWSDFSVLLTKMSLMSLLCLNEMSGGSEKILLVSSFILIPLVVLTARDLMTLAIFPPSIETKARYTVSSS